MPLSGFAQDEGAQGRTYELSGMLAHTGPIQMELTIAADSSIRGYYFAEAVKRPHLLFGRLEPDTGRVDLKQYDHRCSPIARFEGVLQDGEFTGFRQQGDEASAAGFSLAEQRRVLTDLNGDYSCSLDKGQFISRMELGIEHGRLRQFTYITEFVGGRDNAPWYCAVNSAEPNFEAQSAPEQITLRDTLTERGCRVMIRDTGTLLTVRFKQCDEYCQRTALPDTFLIEKLKGTCAEFAVPRGNCPQ